jgi:hypothetical protein
MSTTMMFYDLRMVLHISDSLSSKELSVEMLMASFFVSPFTCLLAQVTRRFLALQMCCSSPNIAGERRPRHTAEKLERCTHNTFECTGWRHCCWDCRIRLARVPNRRVLIKQFTSWFLYPPTLPGTKRTELYVAWGLSSMEQAWVSWINWCIAVRLLYCRESSLVCPCHLWNLCRGPCTYWASVFACFWFDVVNSSRSRMWVEEKGGQPPSFVYLVAD